LVQTLQRSPQQVKPVFLKTPFREHPLKELQGTTTHEEFLEIPVNRSIVMNQRTSFNPYQVTIRVFEILELNEQERR
jgi:hypothetical protein